MNKMLFQNDDDFAAQLYCKIFEKSEDEDDYNPRRILDALYSLSERERYVIEGKYKYNETYEKTAEKIGVSGERVRQILLKAIRKLREPQLMRVMSVSQIERERDRYKQTVIEQEAVIQELRLQITRLAYGLANANFEELSVPTNKFEWDICELGLSIRSYNGLARAGYVKVQDVYGIPSYKALCEIKNLGAKSREEVIQRMRDVGFKDWASRMYGYTDSE